MNIIRQSFFALYGSMNEVAAELNRRATVAKEANSDAVTNVVRVVYLEHKPGKDGMFEGLAVTETFWVK